MGVWPGQGPSNKRASCWVKGNGRGQADDRGGILWERTGGGLAEKENEANKSLGVDVSVMLLSSMLS
jgi:hypothetical protein